MSLTSTGGALTTGLWIGDSPLTLLKLGKKHSGFDSKKVEHPAQWFGNIAERAESFEGSSYVLSVDNKDLDLVTKSSIMTSCFLLEHKICKRGSILLGEQDKCSSLKQHSLCAEAHWLSAVVGIGTSPQDMSGASQTYLPPGYFFLLALEDFLFSSWGVFTFIYLKELQRHAQLVWPT